MNLLKWLNDYGIFSLLSLIVAVAALHYSANKKKAKLIQKNSGNFNNQGNGSQNINIKN